MLYDENLSNSEQLEFPRENRLIFDWVSFSTRIHEPGEIMNLLGMRDCPWEILTSGNGYTHRHHFGGVSISFVDGDMSHVGGFYLLDMSGKGCRTFETYGHGDYDVLFNLVRNEEGKPKVLQDVRLTRLDVAYDDLTGVLNIDQICDKTRLGEFVSRIQRYESIYGSKGNSVNFGSKGSNVFIRIYDKARERGFTDGRHWIRCELQIRKENACGFVNKLARIELSELYTGVLKNYLSFREVNENDSNKRRWEESPWWTEFLDHARAISIVEKPGVIYNLSACEKYVLTQPVGSIKTLIQIFGPDEFIEMIRNAPNPKNPKYKRLINQVEMERARQESLPGDEFVEIDSDDCLIEMAELRDELRTDLLSIDRDARGKALALRKKKEAAASTSYLRSHGYDPLSEVKKKIKPGSWAEEYLRKRGFDLK